jgi:FkbM family methyltransferase
MKKLIYYILNFTFHRFEAKIIKILKNEKNLVVFDIGCFRGVFTRNILELIDRKKIKFYLFDINKNTKKYISNLISSRNISYNEVALSDKNGTAEYNYNSFFESSGSSLSPLFKNDAKWISSRKLLLKILLQSTKNYVKYRVPTLTLDTFVKKKRIKSIDLLKVDIDGSEYEFLQGAKVTLKDNKIKVILIEINDKKKNYKKKEKKIINFLKKQNFTFLKKHMNLTVILLSDLKSGDYLFINNSYLKKNRLRTYDDQK